MVVETLGDALAAGWRITARCAWGKRDAGKSRRECTYTRELDLETLVWTTGPNFPPSSLTAGSCALMPVAACGGDVPSAVDIEVGARINRLALPEACQGDRALQQKDPAAGLEDAQRGQDGSIHLTDDPACHRRVNGW
jgi:hypothetical protein